MKNHLLNNKHIYGLIAILFIAKLFFFFLYGTFSEVPDSFSFNFLATEMLTNNFNQFLGDRSPGYPFILYLFNHNKVYVVFLQFLMGIMENSIT